MEKTLREYLKKHKIKYKEHKHPAVFTVEESLKAGKQMPEVFHTKNLFLQDKDKNLFLVCMDAHERLDLKFLRQKLKTKKLSFASSEKLKEQLNLTPGSVSIFGMIHAKNVSLVIDKKVWEAKKVGFHPNINTSTLELAHESLERFVNSLNSEKLISNLCPKIIIRTDRTFSNPVKRQTIILTNITFYTIIKTIRKCIRTTLPSRRIR